MKYKPYRGSRGIARRVLKIMIILVVVCGFAFGVFTMLGGTIELNDEGITISISDKPATD